MKNFTFESNRKCKLFEYERLENEGDRRVMRCHLRSDYVWLLSLGNFLTFSAHFNSHGRVLCENWNNRLLINLCI